MKYVFLLTAFAFVTFTSNADNVQFRNDSLFCNLTNSKVGTLKARASCITDLNAIKTIILAGYISQSDEDFIHTLGKDYNLQNLDMTELRSSMSYQGLRGCVKLRSVKYSKHWNSTGEYLFEDCVNLTEVIFPEDSECGIISFSTGTFRGCSSLETITIPEGIKSLDSQVFYLCSKLKEIHCKSGIAPFSTRESFGDLFSATTIFVPTGSLLNYKTSAGWCLFKNYSENPNLIYEEGPNQISDNISIKNDTLFCYLTSSEVGKLRSSVLASTNNLNSIKHVVLEEYLNRSDGDFLNALSSSFSLSSLDMTNLKSTFANYQFQGCSKLKEIKYSKYWSSTGWYLFKDCSNITSIVFPENVIGGYTEFETGSFKGCSSLEEITVPATVTSIGHQCFYLCNHLKKIKLAPVTPPSAKEDCFGEQFSTAKLIVPKGTKTNYKTSSGWSLFSDIEESAGDIDIEEKEISNNVSFSDGTLYIDLPAEEVGQLKSTVLSKYPDLEQIHSVVVSNYLNCEDVSFLNALASSYNLCYIDFTELKSSFGNYAFQGCSKLKEVKYSRYWNSTGWYLFKDCSSLINIQFPNNPAGTGIRGFESGSFRGCSALQNIIIPKTVSSIGTQCFYLCESLKSVTFLGSSVTSIDKGAFVECNSLETIVLPSGLSLIGERCFEGCPNIKEIHCTSTIPPDASESSFDDIYENSTLFVPAQSLALYASAPVWKNFLKIEGFLPSAINVTEMEKKGNNISIYTTNGKQVYIGDSKNRSSLSSGVYIIHESGRSRKIVVE